VIGAALISNLMIDAQAQPAHYLCVVEQSSGLHYDQQTDRWKPKEFASVRKYILRQLNDADRDHKTGKSWSVFESNQKANWAFFEFGTDIPTATCIGDTISFFCKPFIMDASFDQDSLGFELALRGAYVGQGFWEQQRQEKSELYKQKLSEGDDPYLKPDDLFIEIGHCSPF
jgi:hypothetical protein